MMKKLTKSLLGLIAAVAMLFTGLALPSSAVAAETYSITIGTTDKPVTSDHTFEAYRVFAGDLSEAADGTTTLSNITGSSGVCVGVDCWSGLLAIGVRGV